jgi:hypothetical protein
MSVLTQPPQQPSPVTSFWTGLGRLFARLLAERAHVDLIIHVREGKVQSVRVDRRYLPTDLPQG